MLRHFSLRTRLSSIIAGAGAVSYRRFVVGDGRKGVQPAVHLDWTDIVGHDTAIVSRLAAGELLAMMDLCAKRVADVFLTRANLKISTSTVGVTNTMFSSPVLHGDSVRMHGRLVFCGTSSLGIHIRFFRRSPATLQDSPAGESFFTMVAIDKDLHALKVVPAVELTSEEDIELYKRYANIRDVVKKREEEARIRAEKSVTVEDVECSINKKKLSHVPISSSCTSAHRIFLLYHLNNNRTIFGGELMRWMEKHAVHCARMFTGNRHVYTVVMHSVAFHQPVFGTDWVVLQADVIYVRNTTMEVDVKLSVERNGQVVLTNRASFLLINTDEIGQKVIIPKGLDLKSASQDELLRFAEAKARYEDRLKFK
ncbi:ATP-binding protein Cassette (ABC) superfamily [Trypanosoma theileri]|uniref:ATP-binding protein Cassette (ABC) superfamily n=1 Tax=Trypanosoma theileri TaxID=67003 RepID=A0A1X0NZW0_9TRYP|nr:ATP-binding protein Cassette (ABC) superfamily [Trypanosoma theileri]ORC90234.1 ATP-binding protein Cassette (ABC) superfamily [Trypanosoma theileri]